MSLHQSGIKNSQFGTVWIYKDNQTQKVKKELAQQFLHQGWQAGRKPKDSKIKKAKQKGLHSAKYQWILDNENKILEEFDECKSVTKILQRRGFKNREGNQILSNWLKSKGKKILKRRNTNAGVA